MHNIFKLIIKLSKTIQRQKLSESRQQTNLFSAKHDLKNSWGEYCATQGLSKRAAIELKVRNWTVFFNINLLRLV